jgi:DNA-binding NtrC family response regulator
VLPARRATGIHVGGRSTGVYRPGASLKDLLAETEREILLQAIATCGESKVDAAETLKVERSHFYKKCRLYGIW